MFYRIVAVSTIGLKEPSSTVEKCIAMQQHMGVLSQQTSLRNYIKPATAYG